MATGACRICNGPVPHGRKLCDACKPTCLVCGGRVSGRGRTNICTPCAQESKWCAACRQVLPLDAFRSPNGKVHGYCWSCFLHKERVRRREPDYRRWGYMYHLRRKFGISEEEAARLEAIRQCAVCGHAVASYDEARRQLRVDHCHTEGRIRGVVCRRCNLALAALDADPGWLAALLAYRNS